MFPTSPRGEASGHPQARAEQQGPSTGWTLSSQVSRKSWGSRENGTMRWTDPHREKGNQQIHGELGAGDGVQDDEGAPPGETRSRTHPGPGHMGLAPRLLTVFQRSCCELEQRAHGVRASAGCPVLM